MGVAGEGECRGPCNLVLELNNGQEEVPPFLPSPPPPPSNPSKSSESQSVVTPTSFHRASGAKRVSTVVVFWWEVSIYCNHPGINSKHPG